MAGEDAKHPPCSGDNCDTYKLHRCQAAYMFSPEFYREVFDQYFSPQWQARDTGKEMTGIWGQALALPPGTKGIAQISAAAMQIAHKKLAQRFPLSGIPLKKCAGGGAVAGVAASPAVGQSPRPK